MFSMLLIILGRVGWYWAQVVVFDSGSRKVFVCLILDLGPTGLVSLIEFWLVLSRGWLFLLTFEPLGLSYYGSFMIYFQIWN